MWPSLRGSNLIQVYFYRKLTFGTLISWTSYVGDLLIVELTTMAGFDVYLHVIWKYQPIHSSQINNRVKLPKWLYWKVMILSENNTISKNMRKKHYQRSKLPDFWFSCSLHSSLNISPFATKSIWRNLQVILLKNCWIWSCNLDMNGPSLWTCLLKSIKLCKAYWQKKKKDFCHGICK